MTVYSNKTVPKSRDDRLSWSTYLTFAPLALVSAIFGPLLFLLPNGTQSYFSWTITPAMSAVFIGAGYISGAIAITRLLLLGRWHPMRPFTLGGWAFTLAILGATLLHWDRFHHGTIWFNIWLAIYIIGPIALPIAYLLNQPRNVDPSPVDLLLAAPLRLFLVFTGAFFTAFGVLMFVVPEVFTAIWPWTLTPLVGRVIAAWIFLPSFGAVSALFEPRYTAYRPLFLLSLIWVGLLLLGSVLHLGDFDFNRPFTWVWFVFLAIIGPGLLFAYRYQERRFRMRTAPNSQGFATAFSREE